MTPERYEQIGGLYQAALAQEPAQRVAFLIEACDRDETLCREVVSLLAAHDEAGDFIEQPPDDIAAGWQATQGQPGDQFLQRELAHYRLLSLLGKGGMGEVYLAEDTQLKRRVALKLLPAAFTTDADRVRRFTQEARAASALNHPNIVTIHEIGATATTGGSTHYIIAEYVAGPTLRQHLADAPQQRLLPLAALTITMQIAAALSTAHEAGIIHRDIKPENVMLRPDGIVKVLDFGLAKLTKAAPPVIDSQASMLARCSTESGVVLGTPRYMSPEQARGEEVDVRSDIFSLGALLYEMIGGCAPFTGATPGETIAAILRDEPPPLADTPPELVRIIKRALRKDRRERYQSANELRADLKALRPRLELASFVVPPLGGNVRLQSPPPKGATTSKRRRAAIITLAVVVMSITALAAWFYLQRRPTLSSKDTVLLADFENKTGDAIFDGTLKQWLATQLEQAQLLNVFPETRVRQTLRQMERPADARVTAEMAQEMCERQNLKAFIAGSIAPLGTRYVITLAAIAGQSGEALTRAQAEAASKEEVLQALSQATTQLCAQLGRSLSALPPSARALQQITTADLRAVKAYSEGIDLAARGRFVEALPLVKRAVELDPQLAGGYTILAILSFVAAQPEAAAEHQRRAWQLLEERAARQPDQVSEVSKAAGLAWYHRLTTGNQPKQQEYGLLYRQLAPRHAGAHNDLGFSYLNHGQLEQAIASLQEAISLNPNFAAPYRGLTEALTRLNRFAEAQATVTRALELKLEFAEYRTQLYQLAFIAGDAAGRQEQLAWAKGKPDEYAAFDWQTQAAAFTGQWRRAQELSRQAINLAALGDNRELAARYTTEQALRSAVLGDCRGSKASIAQGLTLGRGRLPLARAALALALCGEARQAQSLVDELTKRYPEDTLTHSLWVPATRAAMSLQRAEAGRALEQLQATARYEAVAEFWPQYLRGQAYLQLQQSAEAAAEFQKILDHRGYAPLASLYPLAQLGLARATHNRKAYGDFLNRWRDADADLPLLLTARKEAAQP